MTMDFISADLHLGHAKVIQYCQRPFISVEEHDKVLISRINERVGENDRYIHVGDFSFRNPYIYIDQIKCRNIWLFLGNHDHRRLNQFRRLEREGRIKLIEAMVMTLGVHQYHIYHFPLLTWFGMRNGTRHIHGHCHMKLKPRPGAIDVGVDGHQFYPWSRTELEDQFSKNLQILGPPSEDCILTDDDQ